MGRTIGIDLGTTNSVAAILKDGRPVVIPNNEGTPLTPSVVAVTPDGGWLVGHAAKSQAATNPGRTIRSIKRSVGTCSAVLIDGREYAPQEISSHILRKVKADAERHLGESIDRAVVTVPAYFNDNQRNATREAAVIAGLDVARIVNEPTAAALAYGLDRQNVHTVLVWDLGGGTFDVSILELGEGVFEVKAVAGDTRLGGDDWDERLVGHLIDVLRRECGVDLRQNDVPLQGLWQKVDQAKADLSAATATVIGVSLPARGGGRALRSVVFTRSMFEQLTQDLLQRMIAPTERALADAKLDASDIDRVLLVGGATRMPAVKRLVRELIGKEPYADINPDEAVAMGAAIQAGILTGETRDLVLVDVTPLSLGIEAERGIFARIIDRNTTVPCSRSKVFTTAVDNQECMDIHVLQGERAMAGDNMSLGTFRLEHIPPAMRGEARVEVTFSLDADGILQVTACDLHADNECSLVITSPTRLSEREIADMIAEAEKLATSDNEQKEFAGLQIKAANLLQAVKRLIGDADGSLDESGLRDIQVGAGKVEAALGGGTYEVLWPAVEELDSLVRELSGSGKRECFN